MAQTGLKIGFPSFSKNETIDRLEQTWSDSKVTTREGVAGCKIEVQRKGGVRADSVSSLKVEVQCKGGVRADSMSSLIVAVGERPGAARSGWDSRS